MKNLKFFVIALLCLHVSLCSMAQQDTAQLAYNPALSYTQNMDNAFANVSKQYITTSIPYSKTNCFLSCVIYS
jgi:hypothetical protein